MCLQHETALSRSKQCAVGVMGVTTYHVDGRSRHSENENQHADHPIATDSIGAQSREH